MMAKQQILLCRLAFVLLCLLPTAAMILWMVQRPANCFGGATKDQWQSALSSRLGLVVELGEPHYPAAGLARFDRLTLRDPETLALMAEAPALEVRRQSDGWSIRVTQLQVKCSQLPLLQQTLEHRLLRSMPPPADASSFTIITFEPCDVTLDSAAGQQTFTQVQATLAPDAGGNTLRVTWQLPSWRPNGQPAQLVVQRNRTAAPPETIWLLDTGGQPMPCALAAELLPQAARLGRECSFAGRIQWSESAAGARGRLSGSFANLDLDALVTEHFSHRLSGLAQLQIAHAGIDEGKLTELSGTLQSPGGSISPSLIEALQNHLHLDLLIDPQSLTSGRGVAYRQLAVGFQLDRRSLAVVGRAGRSQEGIVLADATGPMLAAAPGLRVAPVNLLRALLPDNDFQVPATTQTGALVGLFPLPDIDATRTASLPSHTPTRLRPSGPPESAPVLHQPKLR